MTLRSQAIAALAVLFISLGVVFVAADGIGVETSVFLPDQPTPTPAPPTPVPPPEPSAANWMAVGPGQYQYSGDIEGTANLQVAEAEMTAFVGASGLVPPAEDAAFPLLDMLGQVRTAIEEQIVENGLTVAPDGITGPVIELIGGVPVATLRTVIEPHTAANGFEFPGVDLFRAWFERGDEIVRVELSYQGAPSTEMYTDLRAWLDENIPELAAVEDTGAEETDTTAEGETDAGDAADAATDAEPSAEGDDTSAAEATEEPATQDTDEPAAEGDAAGADAPAEPDAESEAETDAEADTEAESADDTASAASAAEGPWVELTEGMLMHSSEPNTQINYAQQNLADLAEQVGYAPEDGDLTVIGLLENQEVSIRTQLEAPDNPVEIVDFEGPSEMVIGDVTVSYLKFSLTVSDDTTTASQQTFLALIPVDAETVTTISFQYGYETDANTAIWDDFMQWLEDNIAALAAPAAE